MSELTCWCGNQNLAPFSEDYLYCDSCCTLVYKEKMPETFFDVSDDENSFYGKNYWFDHQINDLGNPTIIQHSRNDLPERCVHWLKILLKYRIPPARVVELGSAHGGFVAMLNWAGFDATGLEMSPAIVEYARQTFHIPMYHGPIEEQKVDDSSLDVILLMDVLEHLADPVKTISHCAKLLKPDGLLIFQTPVFRKEYSYHKLKKNNHPLLSQFCPKDHIHLFSKESAKKLLRQAGFTEIIFEPAMFYPVNMLAVASKSTIELLPQEKVAQILQTSSQSRLILALLDIDQKYQDLFYISKLNIKYQKWIKAIKSIKKKFIQTPLP